MMMIGCIVMIGHPRLHPILARIRSHGLERHRERAIDLRASSTKSRQFCHSFSEITELNDGDIFRACSVLNQALEKGSVDATRQGTDQPLPHETLPRSGRATRWTNTPVKIFKDPACRCFTRLSGYRYAGSGRLRACGLRLFLRLLSRSRFSCGCVVGFEWMVVRFVCVICVPLCVRVSRVSRVCPGSPRCLFTGF